VPPREHPRAVAGFHAPDQPADNARRGDLNLEASDFAIVLALDRVERERRSRARGGLRRSPAPLGEDTRACVNRRRENDFPGAIRRADPGLGGDRGGPDATELVTIRSAKRSLSACITATQARDPD
jgi:hypothetical protein